MSRRFYTAAVGVRHALPRGSPGSPAIVGRGAPPVELVDARRDVAVTDVDLG